MSEVSQQQVQELWSYFRALDGRVTQLKTEVDGVGNAVASLRGEVVPVVKRIDSNLIKLADDIARDRAKVGARYARDDLDRELTEKYGPHQEVRRLADSIIHVVSTGVIDHKVILDTAQRRMVDLPDYWLAPAIVAVAAWLSNDEGKCAQALDLAIRLDRSKTALFMTLLLRHHERGPALQQWVDAYLSGLRPRNLPPDFSVVIDGVAGRVLGDGSAPRLASWMITRYLAESKSRDATAEAVAQWRQRLRGMAPAGEWAPTLAGSCPDWAALRERHHVNVVIQAAEEHFRGRFEVGADVPVDLTERMRELVTKLAHTPDEEEGKLRRERDLEDDVFRTGDREGARQRLAAREAGRTGSLNILSLVAASAFPQSSGGKMPAPTVTELLTIVLSRDFIASAVGGFHDGTQRPAAVTVMHPRRPEEPACVFSCETPAHVTREALDRQAAHSKASILQKVQQAAVKRRATARRFRKGLLPVVLLCAAVIAGVPFAFSTGLPALAFAGGAVAVVAAAAIAQAVLGWKARNVWVNGKREASAISKVLDGAAAELATFFEQEQRSARLRAELQGFLSGLTPGDAYKAVQPVVSPPFPRSRDFPQWTPPVPADDPEIGPQSRPNSLQ